MSVFTSSTYVSRRYFMRKSKAWLVDHITALAKTLEVEKPWTDGFDKHGLATIALALHDKLPEDGE